MLVVLQVFNLPLQVIHTLPDKLSEQFDFSLRLDTKTYLFYEYSAGWTVN